MRTIPKIFSIFSRVMENIDIFRIPVTMVLNGRETTSTWFGKAISLAILIYILRSFALSDLVNKTNAQILSQDLLIYPRHAFKFSKSNFSFAIGVADDDNNFFIDESVFSVEVFLYHRDNNENQSFKKAFEMKPCSKEDFQERPEEFEKLGLNNTFCFPFQAFDLSGYWDQQSVDYLWIEIGKCQNSSEKTTICKSPSEIEYALNSKYIDFYITKFSIDSADYLSPISRGVRAFYQGIDLHLYKSTEIYFKQASLETNDGFWFDNISNKLTYLHGEIEHDFTLINEQECFFSLSLYSSSYETSVSRKYQTVQDLLAQLGGICNFIVFLGLVLSKFENEYNLTTYLSNELFIFQRSLKKDEATPIIFNTQSAENSLRKCLPEKNSLDDQVPTTQRFPQKFIANKFMSLFSKISKSMIDYNEKSPSPSLFSKSQEKLKSDLNYYQTIKKKENSFRLGFFQFIKLILTKTHRGLSKKETLFLKAEHIITEERDLLQIMKKLQELEKLKRVVLSEQQLALFNLLSRPLITVDNCGKGEKLNIDMLRRSFWGGSRIVDEKNFVDCYREARERAKVSEIDQRILKMLDQDLEMFLKKKN